MSKKHHDMEHKGSRKHPKKVEEPKASEKPIRSDCHKADWVYEREVLKKRSRENLR